MQKPDLTPQKQVEKVKRLPEVLKGYQWPKGVSGNPKGRPEGSLSAITRIKQMFAANPADFDDFLTAYLKDKKNRKHVIEMIDGKPKQATDVSISMPKPLDEV